MSNTYALDPREHARADDPGTSHAAAAQLPDKTTMLRALLRAFYAYGPMTAEEAMDACRFPFESGAWKRVSDLTRLGLIEDTGRTRPGRSGRAQVVRQITQAGRDSIS